MKPFTLSIFALAAAISLLGCERKTADEPTTPVEEPVARTSTLETSRLGAAVNSYELEPSAKNRAAVKEALAELDGEIAELETHVAERSGSDRDEAAAKLKNLQAYRAGEVARFTAAQAKAAPAADGRTGADKIENTAERIGDSIGDAARETGDAIKDAVQ